LKTNDNESREKEGKPETMNQEPQTITRRPYVNTLFFCLAICLVFSCSHKAAYSSKGNFIVAIDIGHSIKNHGATSARGIGEYHFNKRLAKRLHGALLKSGYPKAFLINETGADILLTDRVNMAKKKNADLLISIHHDSVQPHYLKEWYYKGKKYVYCDRFQGFSIFYSAKNQNPEKCLTFAKHLGGELVKNRLRPTLHHAEKIKGENRELVDQTKGIYRFDDLIVLKSSDIPSVLLECGIIVNPEEELRLNDVAYQQKIIRSIIAAIDHFFNLK
jgi:N-acetylmuramoyl-L-alanine amidase